MHKDNEVPRILADEPLHRALLVMTEKGFGMTTVVSGDNTLLGVFTDGDLRRIVDGKVDINSATMADVMSPNPKTIDEDILAAQALKMMEDSSITALIVEDKNNHLHWCSAYA